MANMVAEKEAQRRELVVRLRAQKSTGPQLKIAQDHNHKLTKKRA